jgi:iron complex transport system ATP-binding protein
VTSLLVAQDLRVNYGARAVLTGVSLEVRAGEILALIGPNGAGKTTLLKALAGLLAPHSGTVQRGAGLAIAYLAQAEELPLDWSAREVVELGRLPHVGFWRALRAVDQAAVEDAMLRTTTWSFADRALGALSGGERQRVTLARALAQEPKLLLLDEPTAHLDMRHQAELLTVLRAEAARGVSSVAVMHDLSLAAHADRCVLLRAGAVIADGAPEAVLCADLLSEAYETALEVVRAADGRRAVVVQGSASPFGRRAVTSEEKST